MDFGLFMVRVVIGLLLIGHGTQKLFGWFGGQGLEGTGAFLESLGYRPGRRMAAMTGIAEAGGGLLLALGLFTPVGAAAIAGVMLNATISAHLPNGLWNHNGGFELPLVLATSALGIAFVGPGAWSLDRAFGIESLFGWTLSGIPGGLGAILLALVAGGVALATRRAPVTEEEPAAQAA